MSNQKRTIYDIHKEERASRSGVGFVAFLSDLDWASSLELEEGRPLDERKVVSSQRYHFFGQGFIFGAGLHSAILFVMNIGFYLLVSSVGDNSFVAHSIWFGILVLSVMLKIAIPLWLLEEYYVFPKGITYTYLNFFLFGYALGLFAPEFVYFLFVLLFMGLFNILDLTIQNSHIWSAVSTFAHKYLLHYISAKYIPVHFLMLVLSFAPLWIFKWWKKTHKTERLPWSPLDFDD